jgi:poly(glycerol-phosphate) alpha-glucosyltransferase
MFFLFVEEEAQMIVVSSKADRKIRMKPSWEHSSTMSVGFVIASVSRKAGGLFESVRRLAQSLEEQSCRVAVFSSKDEFTDADHRSWWPLEPTTFPVVGPWQFGYSPGLGMAIRDANVDILNVHGIWMYPSVAGLRWARHSGKPLIIHAHGMLDSWAVQHHRWRKVVAGLAYEYAHLRRASCLRALCPAEAQAMRQYGLKNPICVIPNGIDLPESRSVKPPPWEGKIDAGRRVLLYLGRIHPKKGLPHFLHAWHKLRRDDHRATAGWVAAIAGWDQGGHETELKTAARELGIADDVIFLGPRFNEDKAACFAHADAFVLPSFSEGLPMAVLEAWAYGLPVVMTPQCNLSEGFAAGAAIEIKPEAADTARGLRELFQMSQAARGAMGQRGKDLVARRFTWQIVARQMIAVNQWVVRGGNPPECIWTDSQ